MSSHRIVVSRFRGRRIFPPRLAPAMELLLLALASFIAPPSASPAQVVQVPAGFSIEKVAGEPSVVFPMFATFDERGRLFVAESSGLDLYAELAAQTRKCRVSVLEDRDGDGRFETARVFADRLVFPMGLVWRDGRLCVADPPDLVSLEDRDDDGAADQRTVVLTGFGHTDNGSLHGLTFGPDGLLYMTMGEPDGYRLTRADGSVLTGRSGALIRCRADGSEPEVLCRGFENLVEVIFTGTGAIIGTDNWYQKPEGGLRDALVHLVEGGLYPMQPDVGTTYPITGITLPPMSLYPAVALSGLAIYRSEAFPAEMRGSLFSAQHNSRKIGRHTLIATNETFRVEDEDFVVGDDPDFHPSDVLEDADGSLLVVDTGGWYVQHCPTGKIRNSQARGGIYRIRFNSAPRIEDPRGLRIGWSKLTAARLAKLLEDRRFAVRDRAQSLVSARGAAALPALENLLESSASVEAKQHALWALSAISGRAALAVLRRTLTNANPELGCIAVRAVGLRADRDSEQILCGLLKASHRPLALAAAEALARCGSGNALLPLWNALRQENSGPTLEHAQIHALYWLANEASLTEALTDPNPRVQRAALFLLDQPPRKSLRPEAAIERLSAKEPALRDAALRILQNHREWAAPAERFVRAQLSKASLGEDEAGGLRRLILAFQSEPPVQQIVGEALGRPDPSGAEWHTLFLWDTLSQTSLRLPPRPWLDGLRQALSHGTSEVQHHAARTAAAWQIAAFDARLLELADDPQARPELRMEAFRAVLSRHPKPSPVAFNLLLGQINDPSNPIARLAAGQLLGRSELTDVQITPLLSGLRGNTLISPTVVLSALLQAGERTFPAVLEYFSDSTDRGWRPTDRELETIRARTPSPLATNAASLVAKVNQLRTEEIKRLSGLEPLLLGGDAERGRRVFFGAKVACSTCHRIGREGGLIGPDLTKIGAVRSGRDLVESIVLPSSTFAQGYESFSALLQDGTEADGVLVRQSSDALVVRDASGGERVFRKSHVQELRRRTTSLMPEGLDSSLSRDEFQDLLAYLQILK